jgi:NAD+ synthase (glutamine-hydrolysing)
MRIALAQIDFHIGNIERNLEKMLDRVAEAREQKADLIVFAELAISGYPPRDFLQFDDFVDGCIAAVHTLAQASTDIGIIVGGPSRNPDLPGKDLHNSAFFCSNGQVEQVVHKALLPNYDVFDEVRYFEPGREFALIDFQGKKIALTICEDIWDMGDDPLYKLCPMDTLAPLNPDLLINISASPFAQDHARERIDILKENVAKYSIPAFYVNQVGSQTELIFDGGSLVVTPSGQVFDEMAYFNETMEIYDLAEVATSNRDQEQEKDAIALIHEGLVLGIKDYFRKQGFEKAILGLSGGIDSAVTYALAAEALGSENVKVVMMPSEFSDEMSISESEAMARNLNSELDVLSIKELFAQFRDTLDPWFKGTDFDITEENLQSRIRGTLLMAMANKFNYILLNTSNKSEIAVGYGTLYGDLAGGLAVLGDVYKIQVWDLARHINREREIIPQWIIDRPPSAELAPDQKDSDSLPDYRELDKILFHYIEEEMSSRQMLEAGHDADLVNRVMRLVNTNEYKRYQTPPILRVSRKAFGMGRRMPIVAKYPPA